MEEDLDIVYEDTGNHLKPSDICYFTTFKLYYDKLDLEKYGIRVVDTIEQEGDPEYNVYVLRGKVENILQAYDDIGEYDFYSEEPVAFFYQNSINL